jgi:uncharacterized protein YdhG (YjbR/CyaY superfamily)
MKSNTDKVEQYIAELTDEKREIVEKLRRIVLDNIQDGFVEEMNWGMITYQVPLSIYPDTYNDKPLMYVAIAAQKNHCAIYLTSIYSDEAEEEWFKDEYKKTGKKMDKGKSCVRFRSVKDIPANLIGEAIERYSVNDFIKIYEKARSKN